MYANIFTLRKSPSLVEHFVKGRRELWDGLFLPPVVVKAANILAEGPKNKK